MDALPQSAVAPGFCLPVLVLQTLRNSDGLRKTESAQVGIAQITP